MFLTAVDFWKKLTAVEILKERNGIAVTSISGSTFRIKREITQITIPANVYKLGGSGDSIARNCPKFIAIHVSGENTDFSSENGVLFNKKMELLKYPAGKTVQIWCRTAWQCCCLEKVRDRFERQVKFGL